MHPVVRSGIVHLYFETIHPFEEGNGRIGRALAEKAISQGLGRPALITLSSTIEAKKKDYYAALELAQFNERQSKVIKRMFEAGPTGFDGGMSARKYIAMTETSNATATRDLQQLTEMGAVVKTGGGHSTRYHLNLTNSGE